MTLKFHILGGAAAIALASAGLAAPAIAQQQAPANQQAAPAQSSQPGQYGTMEQAPNSSAPADSSAPKVNPYTGETGIPSDTPEPSHPNGRDKLNDSTTYPAGTPTPNQNPHR
jgi:hypothetical protein